MKCTQNPNVSLWVLETNVSAIHFYKKHGFIANGESSTEVYKNNKIVDIKMVKSVWYAHEKGPVYRHDLEGFFNINNSLTSFLIKTIQLISGWVDNVGIIKIVLCNHSWAHDWLR